MALLRAYRRSKITGCRPRPGAAADQPAQKTNLDVFRRPLELCKNVSEFEKRSGCGQPPKLSDSDELLNKRRTYQPVDEQGAARIGQNAGMSMRRAKETPHATATPRGKGLEPRTYPRSSESTNWEKVLSCRDQDWSNQIRHLH